MEEYCKQYPVMINYQLRDLLQLLEQYQQMMKGMVVTMNLGVHGNDNRFKVEQILIMLIYRG